MKIFLSIFFVLVFSIQLKSQDYLNQRYDRQKLILDKLTLGCVNLDPLDTLIRIGNLFDFNISKIDGGTFIVQ